ncbi:MAG: hypothetical protein V3T20_08875 [Gemmatimonadota bacterium]
MTKTVFRSTTIVLFLLCLCTLTTTVNGTEAGRDGSQGPLGEWPDFRPIGFITAPHSDNPQYQTQLYGGWGGIVGEEFIFLQSGLPIPSGVYLAIGILEVRGRRVAEARGRIVVLR